VPLYEYHCKKCNHLFERIQKFSDPLLTICPKCGGEVEQLISAPAIQFKGSGWYVTDYAKKSGGPAPSPSSTNGKSEVKAEAKSETKTESKTETKSVSTDSKEKK
jgi:putative FmdB family regulatory protein